MRKKDLHGRILLYLFDQRDKDGYFDLYKRFSSDSEQRVWEIADELRKSEYIDIETTGDDFVIIDISRPSQNISKSADELRLGAKIKTGGIEYVKRELLGKNHLLDKWSKIIGIGGVLFGIFIGWLSMTRESKYQLEHQENIKIKISKDSLINIYKLYVESHGDILQNKEKEIKKLIKKVDSLQVRLKPEMTKKRK